MSLLGDYENEQEIRSVAESVGAARALDKAKSSDFANGGVIISAYRRNHFAGTLPYGHNSGIQIPCHLLGNQALLERNNSPEYLLFGIAQIAYCSSRN